MCWVDCLHFFNRAINLEMLSEFANQEFKWGWHILKNSL